MKIIFSISLVFLLINCTDQKKSITGIEIQNILHSKTKEYNGFELKKISDLNRGSNFEIEDNLYKKIADSIGIDKSFYEADFDENGLPDYLIYGDNHNCISANNTSCDFRSLVLMNFPNDEVKTFDLVNNQSGCFVSKILYRNNSTLLELHSLKYGEIADKVSKIDKQLLIYKFNTFIEYNEKSYNHKIEKIEFKTSGCFGTCPIFELTVNGDRSSVFNAIHFNTESKKAKVTKANDIKDGSVYKTEIEVEKFKEIIDLLDYMNFETLQNSYSVNWTDDQTSILKITYDNGNVKIIKDYGLLGTFGLQKLYELLFNLRENQNWKQETSANPGQAQKARIALR